MGLTISSSGGDYENLEPGRYQATCYKLIDAGTREESYQEGPLRKRHIVYIYWEVTAKQEVDDGEEHWEPITMDDGRLFSASKKYTASLNENAALFKDLKSWRGKPFSEADLAGFELPKVLGVTAELEMVSQGKDTDKVKVEGVYKPDGGMKKAETENDIVQFDIDVYCQEWTGKSDEQSKAMCDIVEDMPGWMKEMIEDSFEVKAAQDKAPAQKPAESGGLADLAKDDEGEEDIPF
jgi:hypothetical protein